MKNLLFSLFLLLRQAHPLTVGVCHTEVLLLSLNRSSALQVQSLFSGILIPHAASVLFLPSFSRCPTVPSLLQIHRLIQLILFEVSLNDPCSDDLPLFSMQFLRSEAA